MNLFDLPIQPRTTVKSQVVNRKLPKSNHKISERNFAAKDSSTMTIDFDHKLSNRAEW